MCGIAGAVWWNDQETVTREVLQRMTDAISHRGPDAEGHLYVERTQQSPGVGLGHRRLSIIDVAGSRQPLGNEDGQIQIVFNGEIYNYRELRADLVQRGHTFATDGDTEVIVHLYEEYGLEFVQHLRGMFAFAVWDGVKDQLVLVRDRLGQKPLFFRMDNGRLSFASELKSLLQIPNIPRVVDRESVLRYMTLQYVPSPHSILQGFERLPPAGMAVLKDGQLSLSTWWSPPWNEPELSRTKISDWQEELRAELTEAVRLRLRSDVPLGAFLSGGIDSTVITGLMQTQLNEPVQTFSIGFPVKAFDERHYARQASEMLGTAHHESVVSPDALELLPRLIWHYDEPYSDSSAVPTMYLSKMTREHVTVALTGDAGDELFCGYDRYRAVRIANSMNVTPKWIRRMFAAAASFLPTSVRQKSPLRRGKRLLQTLAQDSEERYLNWISIFNRVALQQVASADLHQLTH
ncbi:MAG TPA: asparagine synthase (glutamine-hydrolyzing), partial [Planctomycetaceae bacterium]|nr:asparagine synthase (glutamine-hydrolyzing) [Planctomycetaceae bacterium]